MKARAGDRPPVVPAERSPTSAGRERLSSAAGGAAALPVVAGGHPAGLRLSSSPSTVLALQRSAGNRATRELLSAARTALGGPGGKLPHAERIQSSFGRHDISSVAAHTDGAAVRGGRAVGAAALTSGEHVAFASSPDLHTAAHEAAHVIQQRGGVRSSGGVGRPDDDHERHANAVAERVVRGESAEPLLDRRGAAHATRGGAPVVQLKYIYAGQVAVGSTPVATWKDKDDRRFELAGVANVTAGVELLFRPLDRGSDEKFIIPKRYGDREFVSAARDAVIYQDAARTEHRITDLTLFTGHEDAPVASSFPPIASPDHKPAFHSTSFLSRVTLIPIDNTQGVERYKSNELWVAGVKVSDDRPPTKFGGGGQRSHTVAWSLLRIATQGLGGQPLSALVVMLDKMFAKFTRPTTSPEATQAATALYASVTTGLAVIKDTTKVESFSYWQRAASELVRLFVHAYQLSEAATYADSLAVGHGEPGNLAKLREAESVLKLGGALTPAKLGEVAGAAVGMLDYKSRLSHQTIGEILHHWINDLYLAFPALMNAHHAAIVTALEISATDASAIRLAHGADPTTPLAEVKAKPTNQLVTAQRNPGSTALPPAAQSTFVANVVLRPAASAARLAVDTGTRTGGLVTATARVGHGHYRHDGLTISSVDVADDRPNTRFGVLQRSHTVAWTLVRRHLINFKGRPVTVLANFILNELTTLKDDIDKPGQNPKIGFDAPGEAVTCRANLANNIANVDGFPLFQWQSMLSDLIETYVTLYQLSRSATYSKEEQPKGHGEARAIDVLLDADAKLATTADKNAFWTANKKTIVESAVKLVDAAVATSSLKPKNWQIAIHHWLTLVKDYLPNVAALPKFEEEIAAEIAVLEPNEEMLAGYVKPANPREKVLINLYENAKQEVKSVPAAFGGDLQSTIRLKLAEFIPPDYEIWNDLVKSLKLDAQTTRLWNRKLGGYFKNPTRGVARPIPGADAIKQLIDDVGLYFTNVKADRNKLVEFFAKSLADKAAKQPDAGATAAFVAAQLVAIKQALGDAIDEALELSALSTIENYNAWFGLIASIDKTQDVNYATLTAAIAKSS